MSDKKYYVKNTLDDDGYDDTYSVLVGPDGWECCLGEPEDRTWLRDGADVVHELNRLYAALREARARGWREAVYAALDGRAVLDIGDTFDRAMIDRLRAACAALESALSHIDYALGPPNDRGVSLYDVDRDEERVVRRVLDIVARARAVIDAPLLVDAGTEMIEAVRALARVLGEPEPGEEKP